MKKIFKEVDFYTYKLGFTYSHVRKSWVFACSGNLTRFRFGFDWWFHKWKLQELNVDIAFFSISWTRCF